jgi:hypothetical protein
MNYNDDGSEQEGGVWILVFWVVGIVTIVLAFARPDMFA